MHTAGLSYRDRDVIVRLFTNGDVRVLCSTTTLAQGVNLPAHLVIVKGTQFYKRGRGYVEYSPSTILQMIGRAGRPQFDATGVAVVMTKFTTENRYATIVSGQTPVESQLCNDLIGHINAEIAQGTLCNKDDAILWMNNTVRIPLMPVLTIRM